MSKKEKVPAAAFRANQKVTFTIGKAAIKATVVARVETGRTGQRGKVYPDVYELKTEKNGEVIRRTVGSITAGW